MFNSFNRDEVPTLHFELRGLGERIASTIMLRAGEISEDVKRGVQRAAENVDIEGVAAKAAEDAIRASVEDSVNRYFKYGEGRDVIDNMVGSAIQGEKR